ncbi:Mobile element protein [Candidatus Enterovibrio escicola]|uniref:Mobile element protein n=1 Tax=Candidatus Enterovibrio escicola TaxID=1927127 RepID=A0A2A5T360_9GAMM|nr:Mobile element protein [Candidatus Enterovibrio escacola]
MHHGHRGSGFIFSDAAIATELIVKSIFQFSFYVDECPVGIPEIYLH